MDKAGSAAESPIATGARLKTISSRVNAKGASLVIEATEPVSYVTTRPDALTVLLDFRNVGVVGVANTITPNGRSPIASVAVEPTESLGAPASRVRIALAQPVAHHIRSDRNTIVVDFDKASGTVAPYVLPPASQHAPDALEALTRSPLPTADPIEALGLSRPSQTTPANKVITSIQASSAARLLALAAAQTTPQQQQAAAAAAAVAQKPTTSAPASQGNQRRYSGHPVSMQFEGADLRSVLRTFAEISGLNIVIDPTVTGSVDVALTEVPWDQALDIILRANKLGYLVDGTIVRIAPLTVLAEEETQRRKLADEQALAGELRVLTKSLSYARAEELQQLLTRSALSSRGTVQVDARTNTIILTDLPGRLTTAEELITTLDRAQPQVEIEARIVQTNKNYARALGVQWGFGGRLDPALGNTTNLAFPNNGSLTGRLGSAQGPTGQPTAVNLGVG